MTDSAEHVVKLIHGNYYVCDLCGDAGSARWAILHQFPARGEKAIVNAGRKVTLHSGDPATHPPVAEAAWRPGEPVVFNMEHPPRATGGHLIPDHLRFPPHGEKYTAPQVIQQSLEAYMNGGRHGNNAAREPLADFIANELRLHGWDL